MRTVLFIIAGAIGGTLAGGAFGARANKDNMAEDPETAMANVATWQKIGGVAGAAAGFLIARR